MNESINPLTKKIKNAGYTYQEIADGIGMGCHFTTIQKILKGYRYASLDLAVAIAVFIGNPDGWRVIVNPKKVSRYERILNQSKKFNQAGCVITEDNNS